MNATELYAAAKLKAVEAKAALGGDAPDVARGNTLLAEATAYNERADALKSADALIAGLSEPQRPPLPTGDTPTPEKPEIKMANAANVMRFGAIDEATDLVMREVYGGDYRQITHDATRAFTRFLKTGHTDRVLNRQVWSIDEVKAMLKDGLNVAEIKATMIEGQDTLGGYAVPPQMTGEILSRLPGLTAVRGGGARIVQTSSNAIEWLKLTGGGSQYRPAMRGLWGSEAAAPTADDFSFGLETINVNTYTYKVPMSQSLIEDATNIVSIFNGLVTDTLAIDEDTTFLVGDGVGKPRGILPSSANAHSLTAVNSGHATELTWAGLKGLRRGVGSQYRSRGSWIANSASALQIETLVDGMARPYFEYVDSGDMFLRQPFRESESMPDIAASAFPVIYGDMSGYFIVERLGLSVVRFQDSNTGINAVEFHVRRRIGGNVLEPWKFAVQYVSA